MKFFKGIFNLFGAAAATTTTTVAEAVTDAATTTTAADAVAEAVTTTTTVADAAVPALTFEPQRFLEMLPYMGKGMLVIFVLIGVIVLVTMLINKVFSKKSKD